MKSLVAALALLLFATIANAAEAPEFPPGAFTDGGSYRLADFKGKVLVLFFYEQDCPRCKGSIPKRNELMQQYKDKPVKFLAVAAGDTLQEAKAYQSETKLAMPAFADNLSMMEKAYGFTISLRNIWQMRAIDPDGNVVMLDGMGEDLGRVVDKAKWKYKDDGYHAKLAPAIEQLEWNQYDAGMRPVLQMRKDSNKDVAASAEKLYGIIKAEAEEWKKEADGCVDTDAVRAAQLYGRIGNCFPDETLGKESKELMKKTQQSKPYKDEKAAQVQFQTLQKGVTAAKPSQKAEIATFAANLAKKFPDTPTGKRAAAIAEELRK